MENSETFTRVPATARNESALRARPTSDVPATQPGQIEVDESQASADYANFCRISGTPEEILLDFGVNLQPMSTTSQHVATTHRIVTGWHTAKRLLQVLHLTVQRHEAAFGEIETDVQKRLRQA